MLAPRVSMCVLLTTSLVALTGGCARCRKNQAGANLKCDELHDELQQSESPLPIDMRHLPPSCSHLV